MRCPQEQDMEASEENMREPNVMATGQEAQTPSEHTAHPREKIDGMIGAIRHAVEDVTGSNQ